MHGSISVRIVGELAQPRSVGRRDEDVFLARSDRGERDQVTLRRRVGHHRQLRSLGDPRRLADCLLDRFVEGDLLDVSRRRALHVDQPATVTRQADLRAIRRGCRDGFCRPEDATRLLVDRGSPQVHAAPAIAREVEVTAIRGPNGIPVHGRVLGHGNRLPARGGDRPDVAAVAEDQSPVGDAVAVRGPVRLDGVAAAFSFDIEAAPLARRDVDHPELAVAPQPHLRARDPARGEHDLLAIRRPGRVISEVGEPPHRLPRGAHQVDASAVAIRLERDLFAVGRERRVVVVDRGIAVRLVGFFPPTRWRKMSQLSDVRAA